MTAAAGANQGAGAADPRTGGVKALSPVGQADDFGREGHDEV